MLTTTRANFEEHAPTHILRTHIPHPFCEAVGTNAEELNDRERGVVAELVAQFRPDWIYLLIMIIDRQTCSKTHDPAAYPLPTLTPNPHKRQPGAEIVGLESSFAFELRPASAVPLHAREKIVANTSRHNVAIGFGTSASTNVNLTIMNRQKEKFLLNHVLPQEAYPEG